MTAITATGGKLYTGHVAINSDITPAKNTVPLVIEDPVVSNNGVYAKVSDAGSGSWSRVGDVPGYQFVRAENVGAGTPDAIAATSALPISGDTLVYLPVAVTNTASPVTVSLNGGAALTMKTNGGNDVVVGGLVAGMVLLGVVSGSTFRLISDQASAAVVAAAEGAAERAEAAANSNATYLNVAQFVASDIHGSVTFIRTAGYYAPGDGGGAMYTRLSAAPSPAQAWHKQSADGAWWELDVQEINDFMLGAKADYALGGSGYNDTSAIQAAWSYAVRKGLREVHLYGDGYRLVTAPLSGEVVKFVGHGRPKIVAKNMAALDVLTMTAVSEIGLHGGAVGIEFVVEGANVNRFVTTPINSTQYSTYYVTYEFSRNYCHGANRIVDKYSFAWDYSAAAWFHIGDCNGELVEWNNIQGAFDIKVAPAGQLNDVGILLDANSAILSARIHNNNIGPVSQGIRVANRAFMTMSDNDIIGTYDGLFFVTEASLLNEPKVQRNNFNAQRYGIYLDGPKSIELVDNTIRRHSSGWKGATHDWFGVYAANVSDLKLSHNTSQPDESQGAFSGMMSGYGLVACSLVAAIGNFVGVGCDRGFHLDNCTGLIISDTVTAQNSASDILFSLVNNTRRSTIGSYGLVSSWAGTVLSKDASIVNDISMRNALEDFQSTGNIVKEVTRVNAAADSKKWRDTWGTTSYSKAVANDAGAATNFEIVSRTGAVVDQIEWRATQFKFNNGPILRFGSGTPEAAVTGPVGSLYVDTTNGKLYIKATGTGNTGWVVVGTQT